MFVNNLQCMTNIVLDSFEYFKYLQGGPNIQKRNGHTTMTALLCPLKNRPTVAFIHYSALDILPPQDYRYI